MEVVVRNIPPEVSQERIRLYFGNPKRGGPLEMKDFNKNSGCAVISFKDLQDAEKVIQTREFNFKKDQVLFVSKVDQNNRESGQDTGEGHPVLLCGLPEDATDDLDDLELLGEITPDHVTTVTLHKNKGSALVTLKERVAAEMLLELDPEEIDDCVISFAPPSSEADDSKEPTSPRKSHTENDSTDKKENNNTKETSDVRKKDTGPDDAGDCGPPTRTAEEEKLEDSRSNVHQKPQNQAPKPKPRIPRSKGASTSLKEGENDTDKGIPSQSSTAAVNWSTKQPGRAEDESSPDTVPGKEKPLLRKKPERAVHFKSEEKSERETSPPVPVVRKKGKLVIPAGLQVDNIVPNLGPKPRLSKRFSLEQSENRDEPSQEETPVRRAVLPTNVFQQLKGRLKSTDKDPAESEEATDGSEVD